MPLGERRPTPLYIATRSLCHKGRMDRAPAPKPRRPGEGQRQASALACAHALLSRNDVFKSSTVKKSPEMRIDISDKLNEIKEIQKRIAENASVRKAPKEKPSSPSTPREPQTTEEKLESIKTSKPKRRSSSRNNKSVISLRCNSPEPNSYSETSLFPEVDPTEARKLLREAHRKAKLLSSIRAGSPTSNPSSGLGSPRSMDAELTQMSELLTFTTEEPSTASRGSQSSRSVTFTKDVQNKGWGGDSVQVLSLL